MLVNNEWRSAIKATKALSDKLGNPIDKKIIETVTVLRLLGFHTTSSCSGHLSRTTSGPYVIFQSPESRKYAQLARNLNETASASYRDLRKKLTISARLI